MFRSFKLIKIDSNEIIRIFQASTFLEAISKCNFTYDDYILNDEYLIEEVFK